MSFKTIMPSELQNMLENGRSVHIIDVRENNEVAQGMIPGAKHIPLGEIPDRLSELDKEKEYIMVCRSGNRSGKACEYLAANDFKVVNMTGGMMNWDGQTK